jgi:hypothetical protein
LVPPAARPQNEAPVNRAVEAGVFFLKRSQNPQGHWSYRAGDNHEGMRDNDLGTTALAGLTLLECGVPKHDPAVQRAAAVVRQAAPTLSFTYTLTLAIMFLDRLEDPRDKELLRVLGVRLVAGQDAAGGWSYHCPVLSQAQHRTLLENLKRGKSADLRTPGAGPERPPFPPYPGAPMPPAGGGFPPGGPNPAAFRVSDNSNTQFAILALWIARRHDVPVEQALLRTETQLRATQNPDGGWGYKLQKVQQDSTLAMTCAGLLGLATGYGARDAQMRAQPLGERRDPPEAARPTTPDKDQAIQAAQRYISRSLGQGPGGLGGQQSTLYTLWSLERVSVAYGWTAYDGKDWYAWGADHVLRTQQPDGSWRETYPGPVDTCFALLFLKRSNLATDLTARLQLQTNLTSGEIGRKPDGPLRVKPPPTVEPRPDPVQPKIEHPPATEAARLAAELVTAAGPRQEEVLRKLTEGKGGEYTQALAEAIPRLSGAAQDRARTALADRLTRMKADTLRQYLKLNDPELRRAAASACARKEAQEHIPDLIPLLSDADPGVSLTAYEALKRLTGKDLGRQPAAWREWWNSQR